MPKSDMIISKFLLELHSKDVTPMFESLNFLLEYLENKEDPDPEEMHIVEAAYKALENLRTLDALLKQRVGKTKPPTGTRLQELYDKAPTSVGSQVLFKI